MRRERVFWECKPDIPSRPREYHPPDRSASVRSQCCSRIARYLFGLPLGSGFCRHLQISWRSPRVSLGFPCWRGWVYRSSFLLLTSSPKSPLEVGAQSVSISPSTRGANDSIVCLLTFVCWENCENQGSNGQRWAIPRNCQG